MSYANNYGFDVIEYVKKLRGAGVNQIVAEVQAQELSHALKTMSCEMKTEIKQELHADDLATKGDLQDTKIGLQAEIRESELRLQKEIKDLELKLIKWLLGIGITASMAVCGATFTMLKIMN